MKTLGFLISCRWMLLILVGRIFSWDWVAIPPLLSPSSSPSFFILFYFIFSWGRVLLWNPGCSKTHSEAQAVLELMTLVLPQPPKCWCEPPNSAWTALSCSLSSFLLCSGQVRSWFLAELPSARFAEVSNRGRGPGLEAASLAFPSYRSATCFSLDSLPTFFL